MAAPPINPIVLASLTAKEGGQKKVLEKELRKPPPSAFMSREGMAKYVRELMIEREIHKIKLQIQNYEKQTKKAATDTKKELYRQLKEWENLGTSKGNNHMKAMKEIEDLVNAWAPYADGLPVVGMNKNFFIGPLNTNEEVQSFYQRTAAMPIYGNGNRL